MKSFFLSLFSSLTPKQKRSLAYWLYLITNPNAVHQSPAFFVPQEDKKIYEFENKQQGIYNIKAPELLTLTTNKGRKMKKVPAIIKRPNEKHIQNQINQIYKKHNKIFFNRTKHK